MNHLDRISKRVHGFTNITNYTILIFAAGFPEWIACSTGSKPTGPRNYRGVIMDREGKSTTNHPGKIDYKGSSYFFYHNGGLPGEDSFHQSICVEKFTYNADGTIPKIPMIITGVGTQTTPHPDQ